jgi:hypothetical protein
MIQPTTENKYRFDMQVSARAMDGRDRSPSRPNRSVTRSAFEILDRWIALASNEPRPKRRSRTTAGGFEGASQMRDLPRELASTEGWKGCCRQ